MLWVDGEEQRCQPEQPGIDQTRRRDGQRNAAKQRQVPLRQPSAHILPDACAQKGQQHLDRPAAEQKREPAAGKRGCQSQLQRGIAAACLRDLIQLGVQVVRGHVHAVEREALDKALKLVELRGVDAGCRQRQRLREAVLTVGAGVLDGQQPDVGGAHETERPAISFMELRTRHAPVPHESSSSPTRPTTPARMGSGACEMGSSFWSRMGSCHGICIWFGLMIG